MSIISIAIMPPLSSPVTTTYGTIALSPPWLPTLPPTSPTTSPLNSEMPSVMTVQNPHYEDATTRAIEEGFIKVVLCIHRCACMLTCTHKYTHHIHMMDSYITHAQKYACVYIHIYTCIYIHICVCVFNVCVCVCDCVYYTHTYRYVYTHTYPRAHIWKNVFV